MLQEVAEDIFLIPPTDEFKNKINVYTTNLSEDLKCAQNEEYNWIEAVRREVDRIAAKGIVPHETLTVVKSNAEHFRGGWAIPDHRSSPPSIYSFSFILRPEKYCRVSRQNARLCAGDIAHELWGHAFAEFGHEGNDIMDVMGSPGAGSFFNPQHSQYLRDLMELTPYNYGLPKNKIRMERFNPFAAYSTSEDHAISAVVSFPTGTRQLISKIRPVNSNGQVILEYVDKAEIIHAWSEIGKKIPFKTHSPATEYLWQVCSSGLSLPLSAEDPRWTQVEAWPGVFFPNPCAELKFTTPDGMFRVYLPVAGK